MQQLRRLLQPLYRVGGAYNAVAVRLPFATGVVTTVVKTSVADLFAQKVVEKRDEVDWKRHGMFCMFGFAYLGVWQYHLYNVLFVKWCSGITKVSGHVGSSPIKVFIDQFIHHPFMYFPCFYLLKGALEGRPLRSTFDKYSEELWDNLKACWAVWVPAQFVNFILVPRHLRIPFVAATSFIWTVIISAMRGAFESEGAQQPASAPAADMSRVAAAAAATAAVMSGPASPAEGACTQQAAGLPKSVAT